MSKLTDDDLEIFHSLGRRKLSRAVLHALRDGPLRYMQLVRAVSQVRNEVVHIRTLTKTLNYLVEDVQLVKHHTDHDPPDYRLTRAGAEITDLLSELGRWKRQHRTDDDTT